MNRSFLPKLALVTGATSGIGKALCSLLAAKKIPFIATGRNQAILNEIKNTFQSLVDVSIIQADLSRQSERSKLIDLIHKMKPDLVINNAGFGLYGDCLTFSTEEQLEILEVDGKAVVEITLEAARTLITHEKHGTILNVSSAIAYFTAPSFNLYASTKTFINHFSQALDQEVKEKGIRILTMCPGMVDTDFQSRAGGKNQSTIQSMSTQYVAEAIWKQIHDQTPIKIIDWKYQLMRWISCLLPQTFISKFIRKNILSRIPSRPIKKINS